MEQQLKIKVKQAPAFEVYNFMQDLRHLLLIDIRAVNAPHHLRGSLCFHDEAKQRSDFVEALQHHTAAVCEQEAKYKSKKIRRAVFIDSQALAVDDQRLLFMRSCLESADKEFRIYVLSEGYDFFQEKYPFLCIHTQDLSQYKEISTIELLTQPQQRVLYAHSQFPVQVVENELFLGSSHHCATHTYLKDLKIKTVLDFTQPPENLEQEEQQQQKIDKLTGDIDYKRIPLSVQQAIDIDFQEINEYILKQINNKKGPVLIFCNDGKKISPAFAIAYLIFRRNLAMQVASLKVFQYLGGSVDISKWIYSFVSVYSPPKKRLQPQIDQSK